jgi:hypothetical protein
MTICKRIAFSLAVAGILLPAPARAQTSEDQAAARSLFDEGRRLLHAGKVAEACPKLEAAAHIYASPGILLNLGDCYEKSGRTASAWSEFGESASAANRAGHADQEAEARRRQTAIEPKLSRLVIVVSHEVPGLVVSRDGTDMAPAAWGSPIPIDPGAHAVRARADGREAWETSVTVSDPGKTVTLEVPQLQPSPGASASAAAPVSPAPSDARPAPSLPATPDTSPAASHPPIAGIVLVAAGAVVGVGGVVLMAVEAGKASTARTAAANAAAARDTQADNAAISDFNAAKTPWAIGLGGVIAGGVAAAIGVTLIVTSHGGGSSTGAVRVSPLLASGGGGLEVGGAW